MQELVVQLKEFALDQGPEILIAIAILIVGWVVALLGGLLVRKAFKRTEIDNKIATWIVEHRDREVDWPMRLLPDHALRPRGLLRGPGADGDHRAAQSVPDPDLRVRATPDSPRRAAPPGLGLARS
jgi:hypothetical protein